MRRMFLMLLVLVLTGIGYAGDQSAAGKSSLRWKNVDAGVKEATASGKKIMVDVYTDWCGWCKKMDRDVFNENTVAGYLGKQFVLVRLNAESDAKITYKGKAMSEMAFAQAFQVTGYPTLLFLEPDGELITSLPGFVTADKFMPIIKFIGESHYKTTGWEAYLEKYTKEKSAGGKE